MDIIRKQLSIELLLRKYRLVQMSQAMPGIEAHRMIIEAPKNPRSSCKYFL